MYTLADFTRIQRAGLPALPQETLEIIQRLATLVGAEMPLLSKSRPEKQGQVKVLAEIKSGLNKLSDDTYRDIAPELLRSLRALEDGVGGDLIMDTAASNGFYARLYAKLLVSCDAPRLPERISAHTERVLAGDTSCRAFTTFLVHLTLQDGVKKSVAETMVARFQDTFEAGLGTPKSRALNDELVEHIIELAPWLPVARVAAMTKRLPKDFPGLSFKALFKYVDYQEKTFKKKIPVKV